MTCLSPSLYTFSQLILAINFFSLILINSVIVHIMTVVNIYSSITCVFPSHPFSPFALCSMSILLVHHKALSQNWPPPHIFKHGRFLFLGLLLPGLSVLLLSSGLIALGASVLFSYWDIFEQQPLILEVEKNVCELLSLMGSCSLKYIIIFMNTVCSFFLWKLWLKKKREILVNFRVNMFIQHVNSLLDNQCWSIGQVDSFKFLRL